MESKFVATVELCVLNGPGGKVKHNGVSFYLGISKNLDEDQYFEKGMPTAAGSQALTQTLIQGLVGNIHLAHKKGYRKDVEHLEYIIQQLGRGFAEITEVSEGVIYSENT